MTITALPAAPTRSQTPAAFITTADAFLAALPTFRTELNAVAQAGDFNAPVWVSGTVYVTGDRRYSPIDYQTYRRITNGAGTTDPSADATNWAPLVSVVTTTAPRILENLGITVTMAANAVTIALKGANGSDPSSSNKVGIGFRHATLATGSASKVQVTAATSTVISSGSTGGSVSAEASRVWLAAINNAGTGELAWSIRRSGTSVLPIDEGGVISTTAEGGAGAADTAGTWYSTTARASVPFTILGYFDSTQATAGTWASSPTTVVANPSIRPGISLQRKAVADGAMVTGATAIPNDNTAPLVTEGDQYLTLGAVTPLAAANLLRVRAVLYLANDTNSRQLAFFNRDGSGAVKTGMSSGNGTNIMVALPLEYSVIAGSTAATTFTVRAGSPSGTTTFNGEGGVAKFNSTMGSFVELEEISV